MVKKHTPKKKPFLCLKNKMISGLLHIFHGILNKPDPFFLSEHTALLTSLWTGLTALEQGCQLRNCVIFT